MVYSLTLFGVRYKQIVETLKCKQKLCGFAEDKSSNRRKVLICGFHKKLPKVIIEKTKPISEQWDSQIANSNPELMLPTILGTSIW